MTAIQTAFENYCHGKLVDLKKRADGSYQLKSTRAAFREFKIIYEIGLAAGRAPEAVISGRRARGDALQTLASQARGMGMGYRD